MNMTEREAGDWETFASDAAEEAAAELIYEVSFPEHDGNDDDEYYAAHDVAYAAANIAWFAVHCAAAAYSL